MSKAFVEDSARELEAITIRLAWRQWGAIGGSAASKEPWHSIVDPESLILASLFLMDREPRIHDILFSWIHVNAGLLSVQHLKNLQKDYPPTLRVRVSDFARQARTLARHPRWSSLADDGEEDVPSPEWNAGRAAAPRMRSAASLMLRLRLAMGVSTKADVLTVALGSDRPLTVRQLSDNLSYTAVGVRSAVNDLSTAGFMVSASGKPAAYTAPHSEWSALLGLRERPLWVAWHFWFALVADYLAWADKVKGKSLGDYAIDVKLRELLARHELFFRYVAHELLPVAFLSEVGDYPGRIRSLIEWARRQDQRRKFDRVLGKVRARNAGPVEGDEL